MIITIIFITLPGAFAVYQWMKLEMPSAQCEKVNKILEFTSIGLAIAVCVLPFFLFKFPAAIVIGVFMAVASIRWYLALIILCTGGGFLIGGEEGFVAISLILGFFTVPAAIISYFLRNHSSSKSPLNLGENKNEYDSILIGSRHISTFQGSLRKTAIYCSLAIIFVEFRPLEVDVIELIYSREKALPRLFQSATPERYGSYSLIEGYGKEALPLALEMLQREFQSGWKETVNLEGRSSSSGVSELTELILEIGEAEKLSQLGDNQKVALRAAVSHGSRLAGRIGREELIKLKAIPELISSLNSLNSQEIAQALLQFPPRETIPALMNWQATNEHPLYSNQSEYSRGNDDEVSTELAKYGVIAVLELTPYLSDEVGAVRGLSTEILLRIGKPAIPALKEVFLSDNHNASNRAAYILGMLGEKSALPLLIKKIKSEDSSLLEALSFISDERATQFIINEFEAWKVSFETNKGWMENENMNSYEILIANTKTPLARIYLEKSARQENSLSHRKQLIDTLCTQYWRGEKRETLSEKLKLLSVGAQTQFAAIELRKMGDPVVLPFLIEADEREHKTGNSIENCEIHAAIAAFSK